MWKSKSFLSLVFELLDKAFPDTIETCEETAPQVLVTPENIPSVWVNHRQVRASCRRLLIVVRHGVFGDVTVVSAAGLATSEDNVAAFVGVRGEKKYQVGLLWVG